MNRNFRSPHWGWWISILSGMGLTAWIAFGTSGFALWSQWITRALPQTLFQWIFWLALLTHIVEGFYAWTLARRHFAAQSLRWGLQTFLLGYPSLSLLLENVRPLKK